MELESPPVVPEVIARSATLSTGPGRRRASFRSAFFVAFMLVLLGLPSGLLAQNGFRADPRAVEAAFIRNFTHYVTWPDNAFSDEQTPWRICVLGKDPFGDVLERTFEGRTEKGRAYAILRADDLDELEQCQIVYVAYHASNWRRAALEHLKEQPVLTVSNAPDFLQEGGMIRFEVNDFVQLSVNLDSARQASLAIQTKVLEVANAVLENGRVRRVR